MRILIATSAHPTSQIGFESICQQMRDAAADGGLTIPAGILWTGGPGCTNLAFDLNGDDAKEQELFAKEITMALMPAQWTTTSDPLPDVDTCEV